MQRVKTGLLWFTSKQESPWKQLTVVNNFNWDFSDLFNEFLQGSLKIPPGQGSSCSWWKMRPHTFIPGVPPASGSLAWIYRLVFFKCFWAFIQDNLGKTWTTLGFALQKYFPSHFLLEKSPPKALLPVGSGGCVWGASLCFVQVMSSEEMALVILWSWLGLWWWSHREVKAPLLIIQLFDSPSLWTSPALIFFFFLCYAIFSSLPPHFINSDRCF